MATGSCSARNLFAVTLGLYLLGFCLMVTQWNESEESFVESDILRFPDRRQLKFEGASVDYHDDGEMRGMLSDEDADKDDEGHYNMLLEKALGNRSHAIVHANTEALVNTKTSVAADIKAAPRILSIANTKAAPGKTSLPQPNEKNQLPTSTMTKLTWEDIQDKRRSTLKQACQHLADKPPLNNDIQNIMKTNKRLLWPYIVNDKYKLMYCYISKVGSTHWKMAFLVLQGKYKRVEDVPGKRAHDPSLKKLSSYPSVEEITHRLDNYTTFIFVRNPFARIISGYRSKLEQSNPSYHKGVGRTCIKRYRKNPTAEELKGHGVTFPEFVKYLTDPRTKSLDGHFKPMYQMVLPCSVRFDFIGKLETAEEDAKYILENTHVDHLIHFKQTQRNVSHDQATFDRYFAQVPQEDVKKLYQKYYPDFALFGYVLPEYMKSWVQ